MNDELCNPNLWSTTPSSFSPNNSNNNTSAMGNGHHVNGDVSSDSGHHFEMGGGALDEARLRYKSSVTALRSVLAALPNSQKLAGGTAPPLSTKVLTVAIFVVDAIRGRVQ
ncbi:hypothetical protein RHMOL_Rhmol09G0241800 [Rhododendron molle]|uniref:Uncharacterized protein n=1 Tax=Rhododendron molle TaxID=49168 RepID=A0ACC0MH04_RHOML|nr:hypothetical protein RHMOL_Rhmol09G0241800 [Rhododendron molle]